MRINWRGWTSLTAVKAISAVLVPVLLAVFCTTLYATYSLGSYTPELLFADLDRDRYFYKSTLGSYRIHSLSNLLRYESEQAVRDGRYVDWEWADPGDDTVVVIDATDGTEWSYTDSSQLDREQAHLINRQLYSYRSAQELLAEMEKNGLLYYFTDGSRELGNAPDIQPEFFTSRPVHLVIEDGFSWRSSSSEDTYRYYDFADTQGMKLYLAYEQSTVDAFNNRWRAQQQWLYSRLLVPVAALAGALACYLVFLSGCGRRRSREGKGAVVFTPLDGLPLDAGLLLLFVCESLLLGMAQGVWHMVFFQYDTGFPPPVFTVAVFCALFVTAGAIPALWWSACLAKRLKAGGWWKHTLCYKLLHRAGRAGDALWTATPYTLKAVLAGVAALGALVLCAAAPPLVIPFSIASLVIFLWFAHRLFLMERGAVLAVEGAPFPPLQFVKGTFGPIARQLQRLAATGDGEDVPRPERHRLELIANASRQAREPADRIIADLESLQKTGLDSDGATARLEHVLHSAGDLRRRLDHLSQAADAVAGRFAPQMGTLNLTTLVSQCMDEVSALAAQRDISFVHSLSQGLLVDADGDLLAQVVRSALENALHHGLGGSRIYLDARSENGTCRLTVKNISQRPLSGDADDLAAFLSLLSGQDAADPGAGLSLTAMQSLMEAMGGSLSLSVDGDLFKVSAMLPAARSDPGPAPESPEPGPPVEAPPCPETESQPTPQHLEAL